MDRIKELKLTCKVDPDSMYKLGLAYYHGDRVDRNRKLAVKYFEKAAKMKSADACKQLATIYKSGSGEIKKDIVKAQKYDKLADEYKDYVVDEKTKSKISNLKIKNLLKEARAFYGNPDLYYQAGMMLFNGDGVIENKKKALKCFFSGACGGSINAMEKMVECYQNGYGCKVDKGYAQFWSDNLNKARQKEADKLRAMEKTETVSKEVGESNRYAEADKGKPTVKEVFKYMDTPLGKFNQKHTLYTCPSCKHDMLYISSGLEGDLFEKYITIYNPGSIFESVSDVMTRASREGETNKMLFRCSSCGLQVIKVENRKFDTSNGSFGKGKIFTISYKVPSDMPSRYKLEIKKYEGKFKEE